MKRIYTTLLLLLIWAITKSQVIQNRAGSQVTVLDANLFTGTSFKVPTFNDTTAANAAFTLDSCGKMIYTYRGNALWYRMCSPRRWAQLSTGAVITRGVDTIYRTPGKDSILFNIAGVRRAIKDSVGGGGIDTIYRKPGVDSIFYRINKYTYSIKDSISGGTAIDGANSRRWNSLNCCAAPPAGTLTIRNGTLATLNPADADNIRIARYDETGADMNPWFTALDNYEEANPGKSYIQITNSANNYRFGIYEVGKVTYTSAFGYDYWTINLTPVATSDTTYKFLSDQTTTVSWVLFGADGGAGTTPSLQQVTDVGDTTTNNIFINNNEDNGKGFIIIDTNALDAIPVYLTSSNGCGYLQLQGGSECGGADSTSLYFNSRELDFYSLKVNNLITNHLRFNDNTSIDTTDYYNYFPNGNGTMALSVNGYYANSAGAINIAIDTPSLQQVTDVGNTTTNSIIVKDNVVLSNSTSGYIELKSNTEGRKALIGNGPQGYFDLFAYDSNSIRLGYSTVDTPLTYPSNLVVTSGLGLGYSSGTNTCNVFNINPNIYTTGGTNTIRGIYYNPNQTSTTGTSQIAFENTVGDIIHGNLAGTATRMVVADSTGKLSTQPISGGGGTVTSVATGYGLSGGTITTSGTLLVDTATLSQKYMKASDSAKYVPYVGATANVDLGARTLATQSVLINGTNGNGHINLKHQASDASATGQSTALFADANGDLKWKNDGNFYSTLKTQQSANRVYAFQNKSYTLGDSADISARLLISDTATMLSPYLRKVDTASLSSRINQKQNQLNGTGFVKASGTTISYDNSTYLTSAVTSITAGTGLSGGTITSTGTISADTNILSTRAWRQKGIDSVQANVNTKIGGSGTAGSIPKYTSSTALGNATVDVDYLQQDMSLVALQAMGSSIKGYNIGAPNPTALALGFTMTSQQLFLTAIYIPKSVTLTGVRWFQPANGSYTGNNYNGVALYTVSGGTLTLVDSSTRDNACWSQGTNWQSKAFVTPYSASAGIYYVGVLYSSSAQTTAPQIAAFGSSSGTYNANSTFDFTNSQRTAGTLASQTALPTSQALSGTSSNGYKLGVYLY